MRLSNAFILQDPHLRIIAILYELSSEENEIVNLQ